MKQNQRTNQTQLLKKEFFDYIKEELNILDKSGYKYNLPAWHVSKNFVEGPVGNRVVDLLYGINKVKRIYKTRNMVTKIVSRAFNRYLIDVYGANKQGYQYNVALKLFHRWIKEIKSTQASMYILVPVINLEVNRKIKLDNIEIFPIEKNGRLIELEEQIYRLFDTTMPRNPGPFGPFSQSYFSFFQWGSAVRLKHTFNKPESFYGVASFPPPKYEKAKDKIHNFVTILRLFKPGGIKSGNYFSSSSSLFMWGGISHSGQVLFPSGEKYKLNTEKEIRRLRRFYNKYSSTFQNLDSLPSSVHIGIEYFNSSFQKTKMHERFIDLMIALDALLGVKHEVTYRLALRTACFLENDKQKRNDLNTLTKKLLSLRGGLVHGDIHPESRKSDLGDSKDKAEDIVRRIIVKLLSLYSNERLSSSYKDKLEVDYIL